MTKAGTYDWLYQVRDLDRQIKRKRAKLDALRSCLTPGATRYDTPRVQSTPEDKLEAVMVQVDELERQVAALQIRKAEAINDISAAIDMLEDQNEATALTCFYIGGQSMIKVADQIYVSERTAYYIRKRAVRHLTEILEHA